MLKNLFFDYAPYRLEKFQLENLATSQVPFTFYSLDPLPENLSKSLSSFRYLQFCQEPFLDIKSKKLNADSPLVFICCNQKKSKKAVKQAVLDGFSNVYFVDGGFDSFKK